MGRCLTANRQAASICQQRARISGHADQTAHQAAAIQVAAWTMAIQTLQPSQFK
ncbi:hypothetical protein [Limnothrix sp. FACHB-881]|uniref:hypothetical protein n=1 Tax=Limnothrix sp. FACHB-881 TaxID=2692819 RepID=UPI001682ECB3|nr:hypothetical protein [Limnothrix sp. FACHB-881]